MAIDDLSLDDELEEDTGKKKVKKNKKPKKEKAPKPPKPPKEPKEKKQKEPKEPKEPGEGGGLLDKFLFVAFFLLIVGGIAAFLFFNVLDIRQNYVIPQLRRIPLVKNIIPVAPGEEVVDESNPDSGLSKNQLLDKIAMLESDIASLQEESAQKDEHIASLNETILELQKYKDEQVAFQARVDEFNNMIASNDPDAFAAFYEQVDPATAEKIYSEVVKKNELDAELKKYTATFQDMKAASAATVLEELIRTNVDLVVTILENVDSKQRAAILSAMTPRNAAALTQRIIPNE